MRCSQRLFGFPFFQPNVHRHHRGLIVYPCAPENFRLPVSDNKQRGSSREREAIQTLVQQVVLTFTGNSSHPV